MSARSLRRKALPLLLGAALLAPWASAATPGKPRTAQSAPASSNLLARARSFLLSLWSEEGCMIDPNGRCLTDTPQASAPQRLQSEEGCMIDPNGRCRS